MPGPTTQDHLLGGRYRLLEAIGAGGMGTVHRAHDTRLDRPVAVKLLRAGEDIDDLSRARLQAEARFAGALHHAGIVRVYDYGEDVAADGRATPYVVMQHVEGTPLAERLRERGPMPPGEVAGLVAGVADALDTAHAAGIVHRDLKPSNILLAADGRPVLVDFGVARSDDSEPLTQTGFIVGTADYLSPEQVEGTRATGASDVYSLGVVAYQCLTATSPFRRDTPMSTALAHLHHEVPELPLTVPAGLRSLVGRMLDRDPAARPTAAEVAARVADATSTVLPPPAASRLPSGPAVPWPAPAHSGSTAGTSTSSTGLLPFKPRRRLAAGVAAAVLLAGGVGTVITLRDGSPAAPPASAADLVVPSLRGAEATTAVHRLERRGFEVVTRTVDGPREGGVVLGQSPRPGAYRGDEPPTVRLVVSSGMVGLDAGALVGGSYAAAHRALDRLGLVVARTARATGDAAAGTVLAVTPADGDVPVGSVVTVTVATAPVVGHPAAATPTRSAPPVEARGSSEHAGPAPEPAAPKESKKAEKAKKAEEPKADRPGKHGAHGPHGAHGAHGAHGHGKGHD